MSFKIRFLASILVYTFSSFGLHANSPQDIETFLPCANDVDKPTDKDEKGDPSSNNQKDDTSSNDQKDNSTSNNQKDDCTSNDQKDDCTSNDQKDDCISNDQKDDCISNDQKDDCTSNDQKDEKDDSSSDDDCPCKKDSDDKDSDSDSDDDKPAKKVVKPPLIGNFSLPTSQQPAALFGFGGNIIDAGEVQFYFFADEFIGKEKIVIDLIPSVLFGINDNWSVFFNAPFTPEMMDGYCYQSRGLEDFFIQLEYAFYNSSNRCYVDQATLVGNVTFPTGSTSYTPITGLGSPSFFLGATYYRTYVDWMLFTSQGAIFTTRSDNCVKYGDQFLYQFGIERVLYTPCGLIYALMLEVDGQYTKKNRITCDFIDPNSGGNVIYVTPSLWISSEQYLIQFGVSFPVYQNLFGTQRRIDYALNLNVAWSFY